LGNGGEDRQALAARSLPGFAALLGMDAADHLRAVIGQRLLGVEAAGLSGQALDEDLRILADEDRHPYYDPSPAATIFFAVSSRSSAEMTLRPLSLMIFFPISTLVPSSLTTSGTLSPTSLTAAITPSAMMSHFMMPP